MSFHGVRKEIVSGIKSITLFSSLLLVFLVAWFLQDYFILNSDVSWLIHASTRLLSGGSYTDSFFETNPPFILYLYSPIVLFKKLYLISNSIAIKAYVFLLSSISLYLCFISLKKIYKNNNLLLSTFLITLCVIYLILPMNEFGQREHLLIIFTFPYFLLMATQLDVSTKTITITKNQIMLIGLMAGLGFTIKPYFYIAFLSVELYYLFRIRKLTCNIRSETTIIFLVLLAYFFLIYYFNFDYITTIIPLIINLYYQTYSIPLTKILTDNQSLFIYTIIIFYWINFDKKNDNNLLNILFLALIGFLAEFIIQRMGWYYHALPMLSVSILLSIVIYTNLIRKSHWPLFNFLFNACLLLALSIYFIRHAYIVQTLLNHPFTYLSLLNFIIFMLVISRPTFKKNELTFAIIFGMLYLNYIIYYYLNLTIFQPYKIYLSLIVAILTFSLVLPDKSFQHKIKMNFLLVYGFLLFSFPFYKIDYQFDYISYYKKLYSHLVKDVQPYTKETVYFFTTLSELIFPLVEYADLHDVSRFWSMAWLPVSNTIKENEDYENVYRLHPQEMKFYMHALLQDFQLYHPRYVFIDTRKVGQYFFDAQPNYLLLFSINSEFKNLWENYHYIQTIDYRPFYKFDIYMRNH